MYSSDKHEYDLPSTKRQAQASNDKQQHATAINNKQRQLMTKQTQQTTNNNTNNTNNHT
jgi:hypothetical protein